MEQKILVVIITTLRAKELFLVLLTETHRYSFHLKGSFLPSLPTSSLHCQPRLAGLLLFKTYPIPAPHAQITSIQDPNLEQKPLTWWPRSQYSEQGVKEQAYFQFWHTALSKR